VLAELERTELEESELESSKAENSDWTKQPRNLQPNLPPRLFLLPATPAETTRSLVALFVLMLACAGFYAAWTYQPGFRAIAQPQIDRVMGRRRSGAPAAERSVGPIAQSREAFRSTGSGRKFGTCSGIANRSNQDTRNRRRFRSEFSKPGQRQLRWQPPSLRLLRNRQRRPNCSCGTNFRDHNHRRAGCQQSPRLTSPATARKTPPQLRPYPTAPESGLDHSLLQGCGKTAGSQRFSEISCRSALRGGTRTRNGCPQSGRR